MLPSRSTSQPISDTNMKKYAGSASNQNAAYSAKAAATECSTASATTTTKEVMIKWSLPSISKKWVWISTNGNQNLTEVNTALTVRKEYLPSAQFATVQVPLTRPTKSQVVLFNANRRIVVDTTTSHVWSNHLNSDGWWNWSTKECREGKKCFCQN